MFVSSPFFIFWHSCRVAECVDIRCFLLVSCYFRLLLNVFSFKKIKFFSSRNGKGKTLRSEERCCLCDDKLVWMYFFARLLYFVLCAYTHTESLIKFDCLCLLPIVTDRFRCIDASIVCQTTYKTKVTRFENKCIEHVRYIHTQDSIWNVHINLTHAHETVRLVCIERENSELSAGDVGTHQPQKQIKGTRKATKKGRNEKKHECRKGRKHKQHKKTTKQNTKT